MGYTLWRKASRFVSSPVPDRTYSVYGTLQLLPCSLRFNSCTLSDHLFTITYVIECQDCSFWFPLKTQDNVFTWIDYVLPWNVWIIRKHNGNFHDFLSKTNFPMPDKYVMMSQQCVVWTQNGLTLFVPKYPLNSLEVP